MLIYCIQITLPFLGILIIYFCYKSLFCGISKERPLVSLTNLLTGEKIPITYWENSIGRDRHCDIVVDSPTVSRSHAVLFRREEGWIIADTNSKTGVFLNGNQIEEKRKVCLKDIINIGGINFEFNNSSTDLKWTSVSGLFASHMEKSFIESSSYSIEYSIPSHFI